MSEKPQTDTEDFDPLAESTKRADIGKQVYEQFMERDAEQGLTPEEHVEGYQDMTDYLKSRPYKDRNGRLHDPITGGFISDEEAGVFYSPHSAEAKDGEEVDEYKSMSLSSLAALSAEAEFHDDRTTMLSVDDEIQQRIIDMDLKDELVERDGSTRENSERSMVLEHVMKLREQYLDKMKKDADKSDEAEDEDKSEETTKSPEEEIGNIEDGEQNPPEEKPDDEKTEKPEDEKPEEFNPWVKFGEVMKEVSDEATNKEIGANLGDEDMSKIAEIAREKVEGRMPRDEEEYYSGGNQEPEGEEEPGGEQEPNREISETTLEALGISRTRYAELSALRRGETLGKSKEELAEAKRNYEIALKQANQELMQILMETEGMTPDQARMAILDSSLAENKKLMQEIANKRIENSSNKRFSRFYKWFGSQQGFKGRVKKGLATAAITAPLGLAAGAVGIAMLGPIAGAVAGAALARGVARGIALSKINKEAGALNLATVEGREDIQDAERSIISWMQMHPGEIPPSSLITNVAEQTTRERLKENRKRTAKLMTIGALVATASAFAASWLLDGGGDNLPPVDKAPKGNPGVPHAVPDPEIIDPLPPPGPPIDIPTGSFDYPWDWAESTFGRENATPMLETLVKRAQDAGLDVKWNPNPGRVRYIEANGASDAESVINVLKKFVKPGELPGQTM